MSDFWTFAGDVGLPRSRERADYEARFNTDLYARLQYLLCHREQIEDVGDRAASLIESKSETAKREDTVTVALPSALFARLYHREPAPLWARLVRAKSALPARLFTLLVAADLLMEPAGGRDALLEQVGPLLQVPQPPRPLPRTVEPSASLEDIPPASSGALAAPSLRTLQRARRRIEDAIDDCSHEFVRWKARVLPDERKRAWTTPQRPPMIQVPTDLWRNGWHLALDKDELGWLMASFVAPEPANRQRERYFAFTRNTNGIAAAKLARANLHKPAIPTLARALLADSNWLPHGSDSLWLPQPSAWMDEIEERDEEILYLARGRRDGREVITLLTGHRIVCFRARWRCTLCERRDRGDPTISVIDDSRQNDEKRTCPEHQRRMYRSHWNEDTPLVLGESPIRPSRHYQEILIGPGLRDATFGANQRWGFTLSNVHTEEFQGNRGPYQIASSS